MYQETIEQSLESLGRVFHNEEDFRAELMGQLRERTSGIVRPELRFDFSSIDGKESTQTAIDLLVLTEEKTVAIELKYPKASFKGEASITDQLPEATKQSSLLESFDLADVGAYDMAMYPFWKDVETLERLVASDSVDEGYSLILTNYADCWERKERGTNGDDFLLYNGRTVSGRLDWADSTSKKTKESYPGITLSGEYELVWESYSYNYPSRRKGARTFKNLLVRASPADA